MDDQKEPCYVRIKKAMELKNLKQIDLVNLTKLSKSAISQYISGKYEPKQKALHLLAKALDVSEAWLMGYDVPIQRIEMIREVITSEEKSFLDLISRLDSNDRNHLKKYICNVLLSDEKYIRKKIQNFFETPSTYNVDKKQY